MQAMSAAAKLEAVSVKVCAGSVGQARPRVSRHSRARNAAIWARLSLALGSKPPVSVPLVSPRARAHRMYAAP